MKSVILLVTGIVIGAFGLGFSEAIHQIKDPSWFQDTGELLNGIIYQSHMR